MSTLVKKQELFLTSEETFHWPTTRFGKDREFRVEWVFVRDLPGKPREIMLAGFLVLLNGDVSSDYNRGWVNQYVDEIPEQVRGMFE